MAQTSITLTASMRSNLSSLKSIQKQMDTTQERLSTGKKVNSAIDNASSYYQSRALTNRAADLEGLLDNMGQGIQTIQAANEGIEAVTAYVDQLKSIANSAYALDPNVSTYGESMASYKEQYDEILTEISKLVKDSSYQGVNLLTGGKLTVTFNESRSHSFEVQGDDVVAKMGLTKGSAWTPAKLKVPEKAGTEYETATTGVKISADAEVLVNEGGDKIAKASDGNYYEAKASGAKVADISGYKTSMVNGTVDSYAAAIDNSLTELSKAVDYLRSYSTELGNNFAVIETRQDFTEAMIDVLETGSDKLVLADMNEESANYLALQTRQQLAINSLALASQSAQSVLSLF